MQSVKTVNTNKYKSIISAVLGQHIISIGEGSIHMSKYSHILEDTVQMLLSYLFVISGQVALFCHIRFDIRVI